MKDVMTKHREVPVKAVAILLPACRAKIIKQRQLVRKPELDSFGYTAIEEKLECTSVESYVSTVLTVLCSDYFLTVDAEGHPRALIGGILDNGIFTVVMALHDDYLDSDLIERHTELGCRSWECHPDFTTDLPQFSVNQGPVDDTEAEDLN